MKYTFNPKGGLTNRYTPQYKIVYGPDKNGTCKCIDEKINNVVFFNIKDLREVS